MYIHKAALRTIKEIFNVKRRFPVAIGMIFSRRTRITMARHRFINITPPETVMKFFHIKLHITTRRLRLPQTMRLIRFYHQVTVTMRRLRTAQAIVSDLLLIHVSRRR
jgi:hypothetical protein